MFRPSVARWFGYAWLVFAAFNLADLAWRGGSRTSWVIAAVLLLITAVVYVTALRPRIVADAGGLRIVNPLREVRVPWGAVTDVDATDMVRVHAGGQRPYRCWAVQAPNRQRRRASRSRAQAGGAAAGSRGGATSGSRGRTASGASAEVTASAAGRTHAEYVAAELSDMAGRGRRDAPTESSTVVTWSRSSLAVVGVGAALVLASVLAP